MRTSQSYPLQIAAVPTGRGFGRVGITFCPGKKQPTALTGSWHRDLATDIEAIRKWGAVAVVSLIEAHEIEALGVAELDAQVTAAYMEWIHLPIQDVSVPDAQFEQAWQVHGPGLRARLRDGFDIVVHCKGGLGRAGTIAARLLIELGAEPNEAISQVRSVRPGSIETRSQEEYVLSLPAVAEAKPSSTSEARRDRAVGALLGLAVGDAVGTTLEFRARDSYLPLMDMVGGGPFHLAAGQWTDDTSMALALADSLIEHRDFNAADLMARFVQWRDRGEYSCTGHCFDIGMTVSAAIRRWERTADAYAGSADPATAGNGSLMRLAPVPVLYWSDRQKLDVVAAEQSRTTHAAPEAISACVAFANVLADAIEGQPRSEVMRARSGKFAGGIDRIARGSWRGNSRDKIESSGYVAHSLEAAMWSVGRTADFRSAVLTAANLGGDADTTAAIAGQLAGALYGLSGIPAEWLAKMSWRDRIERVANDLFDRSEAVEAVG